jgi:copper chaperone NosL
MRPRADTFWEFLDDPIRPRARVLLALLVLPLLASFLFPLWRISMEAPQYPQGLSMDVWSYRLVGGNDGHDIKEINVLNHYIGMQTITREELRDLDWIPFALGGIALLALRAAVLGNVRALIDLSAITAYVSVVAFGRFVWLLWQFGHDLDPKAPMDIAPFMPVVVGTKKIANFTTHSMPHVGSLLLGTFGVGLFAITFVHLWRGRRDALAARSVAA